MAALKYKLTKTSRTFRKRNFPSFDPPIDKAAIVYLGRVTTE